MNQKMNVKMTTQTGCRVLDPGGVGTARPHNSSAAGVGTSRPHPLAAAILGCTLLGLILLALAAVTGCTTQPTALERRLYAIETNPFPVSVTAVPGSNGVEYVTNYAPAYTFQASPAVQQALAIGGMFGPAGEIAGRSHAMLKRHGLEAAGLRRFVAGGDAFARESGGDSVAGHYARLRIMLRRAPLDRISGWAAVLNLLGTPDLPSPPRLFIHERCRRLLSTLPLLQHDPDRPEDVLKVDVSDDGAGGYDAADALRYLVAASPFLPAGASVAR